MAWPGDGVPGFKLCGRGTPEITGAKGRRQTKGVIGRITELGENTEEGKDQTNRETRTHTLTHNKSKKSTNKNRNRNDAHDDIWHRNTRRPTDQTHLHPTMHHGKRGGVGMHAHLLACIPCGTRRHAEGWRGRRRRPRPCESRLRTGWRRS